jgi:lipoate---protein ligase
MADLDVREGRLKDVEVSEDFFLEPPEALSGIAGALEDAPADLAEEDLTERIRGAVGSDIEMIGFSAESVARSVRRALA